MLLATTLIALVTVTPDETVDLVIYRLSMVTVSALKMLTRPFAAPSFKLVKFESCSITEGL